MKIDPTTLRVLSNHFDAVANSMGWTLMRTSHSTFVTEAEDFSCQILTKDGLTVASPKSFGSTAYTGLDYGGVIGALDYREGDLCVVSDPYSGAVATHSPDLHMWKPVFWKGELICFVGNHIHNTDVGGAVPASLSRDLTEVHQEGLRIPPMRLMRDGVMNDDLLRIIATNVRLPKQNWGDLKAQIACLNLGEREIHRMVERFGQETFTAAIGELMDYSARQARAIIAAIPDGDYFFCGYADEDETGGHPVRVAVTLRVRGDSLVIDYTGSDPQLSSAMNIPTGGNERHSLALIGYVYALHTLDPTITMNSGLTRPCRAILPEGTVMNAVAPAAVGMRSLVSNLAQSTMFGAFARACPGRFPASPSSACIMNIKTSSAGRLVMSSLGPVGGGAGGGPEADGSEGSGANMSFLKNMPVEVNETDIPIEFLTYGLVPDSGGPGRYRGGSALQMEFRLSAPDSVVTARNRDHCVFSCWGFDGGMPGRVSSFTRNPGREDCLELGSTDTVRCDPGDVVRIRGAGGGGYGDPLERPAEAVASDVRRGLVSRESALDDYGVVLEADLAVDLPETARRREELRGGRERAEFGHGPGRLAFEAVWSTPRYDAMTRLMQRVPVGWRHFVKHGLFDAIGSRASTSPENDAADVHRAYDRLAALYPDLPPRA